MEEKEERRGKDKIKKVDEGEGNNEPGERKMND